jgi:hypothetical protein
MTSNPNIVSPSRNYPLDILKAIAIIFVLIWHLQPLHWVAIDGSTEQVWTSPQTFVNFFNWEITLTAVPTFYLVSLYLFFGKASTDFAYLKKRLLRLLQITVFWTSVQVAAYLVAHWHTYKKHPFAALQDISLVDIFKMGGPKLPQVGDSVFYFLINLMCLYVIAFLFLKLRDRLKSLTSCMILVFSISCFAIASLTSASISYSRLDNFILYVPIAYYLANHFEIFKRLKSLLWTGYILFAICDFYLFQQGISSDPYGRISILFGAVLLFYTVQTQSLRGSHPIITWLAKYSLGIFATHKYWQLFFLLLTDKLFRAFDLVSVIHLGSIGLDAKSLTVGFTATLGTFITIWGAKRSPLRQFFA